MFRRFCLILLIALTALAADKLTTPQLMELARKKPHELADVMRATLGDEPIKKGTAFASEGPDFIWAVDTEAQPTIYIDDRAAGTMIRAGRATSGITSENWRPVPCTVSITW